MGYGLYLDLLEPLRRPDQVRFDGQLTKEKERCQQALELARQGVAVALISSGESGMYGMAGLALEQWLALPSQDQPGFSVHPGISAFQMAAARLGAPLMHDLCTISLSDRLTPWELIEQRLKAAAKGILLFSTTPAPEIAIGNWDAPWNCCWNTGRHHARCDLPPTQR